MDAGLDIPMALRPTTNFRKPVVESSSIVRRRCKCSIVKFISPDIRTDSTEPRTEAVVPTRLCVASFQAFRRFPIRFETQACACVDRMARMIGTRLIARTCLDKSATPTMTSMRRAQDSFSSLKVRVMLSTSSTYQRVIFSCEYAEITCRHESDCCTLRI